MQFRWPARAASFNARVKCCNPGSPRRRKGKQEDVDSEAGG